MHTMTKEEAKQKVSEQPSDWAWLANHLVERGYKDSDGQSPSPETLIAGAQEAIGWAYCFAEDPSAPQTGGAKHHSGIVVYLGEDGEFVIGVHKYAKQNATPEDDLDTCVSKRVGEEPTEFLWSSFCNP